MRSSFLRSLAVPVVLSVLSGCAFTQWTDRAFIGTPSDPPDHANRAWIGAVVLPAAIVGDILSAPVQVVMLMVMGDWSLYHRSRHTAYEQSASLLAGAEARFARLEGVDPKRMALGVDADGNVTEIAISADQHARLLARAETAATAAAPAAN